MRDNATSHLAAALSAATRDATASPPEGSMVALDDADLNEVTGGDRWGAEGGGGGCVRVGMFLVCQR